MSGGSRVPAATFLLPTVLLAGCTQVLDTGKIEEEIDH